MTKLEVSEECEYQDLVYLYEVSRLSLGIEVGVTRLQQQSAKREREVPRLFIGKSLLPSHR